MTTKEQLIETLKTSLDHPDLGRIVAAALTAISRASSLSISDDGDNGATDRQSLLGSYRLRQKHLARTGAKVDGFDETIASISKRKSLQVRFLVVAIDARGLVVLLEPPGVVVGCFFVGTPDTSSAK